MAKIFEVKILIWPIMKTARYNLTVQSAASSVYVVKFAILLGRHSNRIKIDLIVIDGGNVKKCN